MKLLGRSFDGGRLAKEVRARLTARGIAEDSPDAPLDDEAPIDPHAFLVQALEADADPVQAPPSASPGLLRGLLRFAAGGVLEELLGRQRAFNAHVRDLAAQLSAEVIELRQRLAELERQPGKRPADRAERRRAKPRRRTPR